MFDFSVACLKLDLFVHVADSCSSHLHEFPSTTHEEGNTGTTVGQQDVGSLRSEAGTALEELTVQNESTNTRLVVLDGRVGRMGEILVDTQKQVLTVRETVQDLQVADDNQGAEVGGLHRRLGTGEGQLETLTTAFSKKRVISLL